MLSPMHALLRLGHESEQFCLCVCVQAQMGCSATAYSRQGMASHPRDTPSITGMPKALTQDPWEATCSLKPSTMLA